MRHDKLFDTVAQPGDTPQKLAARLSVEDFGWPPDLEDEVKAFRKLRTDARESAARMYLMRSLAEVAANFVRITEDRRQNYIALPNEEDPNTLNAIFLAKHDHIIDAKAEWADLVWLLQSLFMMGQQSVIQNTLDSDRLAHVRCHHCGTDNHKCEGMVMNAGCHPGKGTVTTFNKGQLVVTCAICEAHVATFAFVKEASPTETSIEP